MSIARSLGGGRTDRRPSRSQASANTRTVHPPSRRRQRTSRRFGYAVRLLPGLQAPALFAKTEVLGFEQMEYELTPDAVELGLNAALPAVLEIGKKVSLVGARGVAPTLSN